MAEATLPFTAWLKRQRRVLDLTQEELAQQIGCALATMQKIEAGVRRPSKQIAARLAAALHVPPAEQAAFIAYARALSPEAAPVAPVLSKPTPPGHPWQAPGSEPRRHNLPRQLTSFIGRQREMAEVKQLLAGTCLLTLTGAGGSGKTRLALQVAEGLVEDYPDGVWWVDLARLADPGLLPQSLASGLGLRPEAGQPVLDQVAAYLQRRHLLLLLDNCEHLIAACASFADAFLRTAPRLTILATSREPLAIAGETIYRVPTLEVADPQHLPPLAELAQVEAVRLFAERAAAAQVGFALTADNMAPVAEICQRLDGMPLAIELAAARVKLLPVGELCARLHDRFRLLTGGSRTAMPRHQTLGATVEWSYGLLSQPERVLFRRLAVFAGGWDLEAAEAVCGGAGLAGEVLEALAGLVDKSLAVAGWQGKPGRYGMLETMRQYAQERLAESREERRVREAHARYFLGLAERVEPELFTREQNVWLAQLEEELANLRVAYAFLRGETDPLPGLRLAAALGRFWWAHAHLAEGTAWLAEMLERAGPAAEPAVRGRALLAAGVCGFVYHTPATAAAQLEESLNLLRDLGDRRGVARSLLYQGYIAMDQGLFEQAHPLYDASVALCREIDNRADLGWAIAGRGTLALYEGDLATARPLLEEALGLCRELDDQLGIAWWQQFLTFVLEDSGDWGEVAALSADCVRRFRRLGDRFGLAFALQARGEVELLAGELDASERDLKEALALTREVGMPVQQAGALAALGELRIAQGRLAEGLRLGSACAALAEAARSVIPKGYAQRTARAMRAAMKALGPAAARAAWAEGRTMPPEQVIAEALGEGSGVA